MYIFDKGKKFQENFIVLTNIETTKTILKKNIKSKKTQNKKKY